MKKCANHYAIAVDLGASGGKMAAAYHDWIDRCDDGRGRAHQGQHD